MARRPLLLVLCMLALAYPASSPAAPVGAVGTCGLIAVGAHRYLVVANTVTCAYAKRTAARLIALKPKLAPGKRTGRLPSPSGLICTATLGPGAGTLQLNGGCSRRGAVVILWDRAS